MADLTLKQRRRCLEFAARVSALAMEAPDEQTKKVVYAACRTIEKQYGFSREEKKLVILRLVTIGAASITELIQESNFHRDDVYALTGELVAEKRIREQWLKATGGNGRSSVRFFPVDDGAIYSEI